MDRLVEPLERAFLQDQIEIKGITIDSEEFKNKEGKDVRVSIIEITLIKK